MHDNDERQFHSVKFDSFAFASGRTLPLANDGAGHIAIQTGVMSGKNWK